MASNVAKISERELSEVVCHIASTCADGIATFDLIRKEAPLYMALSKNDLAQSTTRPNEKMWEQIIRNIKSHYKAPGNYIYEGYLEHVPRVGYRVTSMGRKLVRRLAA